jgi:hypothetical protein
VKLLRSRRDLPSARRFPQFEARLRVTRNLFRILQRRLNGLALFFEHAALGSYCNWFFRDKNQGLVIAINSAEFSSVLFYSFI